MNMRVPVALHPHQHLTFFSLLNFSHSRGYKVGPHYGFNFHFLNDQSG